jgi:hypothetical protein
VISDFVKNNKLILCFFGLKYFKEDETKSLFFWAVNTQLVVASVQFMPQEELFTIRQKRLDPGSQSQREKGSVGSLFAMLFLFCPLH